MKANKVKRALRRKATSGMSGVMVWTGDGHMLLEEIGQYQPSRFKRMARRLRQRNPSFEFTDVRPTYEAYYE